MANYKLISIEKKLALVLTQQLGFKPFSIDFNEYNSSAQLGEGGRRLLTKAVKIKGAAEYSILDATGGWARDAFFLAQQGFSIVLIERVEPIYLLLKDAKERAMTEPRLATILSRIQLIHADACTLLREGMRHKVIYLDPMFPERSKSAKVKKDLQILQSLPETSSGNPDELFLLARTAAERVVVKRPVHAPFLGNAQPNFQYQSKTVRFDVYTN